MIERSSPYQICIEICIEVTSLTSRKCYLVGVNNSVVVVCNLQASHSCFSATSKHRGQY